MAIAVYVYACTHMVVAHIAAGMERGGSDRTVVVLARGASAEATSRLRESDARLFDTFDELVPLSDGARGAAELVLPLRPVGGRIENIVLRGVTQRSFEVREVRATAGRLMELGRNEVMVGRLIKQRLERAGLLQKGRLRLASGREFSVAGDLSTSNAALDSEVWMDLYAMRAFFADAAATSSYTAVLKEGRLFDALSARVTSDARLDVSVEREAEHYASKARGLSLLLEGLAILVAGVLLLAAVFGAATTLFALVRARQREVGTLKALGFERVEILRSFLLETLVISLAGFVLGITLASLMRFVPATSFSGAGGEIVAVVFKPTLPVTLGALLVALSLGLVSGYLPSLVAARVSPMEAIRG
jgi:putative ABC transport system permease protein